MVGKKILGIIMATSIAFGAGIPAISVQAKTVNNNEKVIQGNYYPKQANVEKIIEMLKREGKIPKNATEEQIDEIVSKYIRNNDPASTIKPSIKQSMLQVKMMEKARNYELEQDTQVSKSKGLQEVIVDEEWKGDKKSKNPLVVLMEFPDFKHTDLSEKDSALFFKHGYPKEYFQNMLFKEGTFDGPDGQKFKTMRQFYKEQSGGSFEVNGNVTGWYMAKNGYKYYGEEIDEEHHDKAARELVKEALDAVAKDPSINLADYDKVDRYDYDQDGDYDEPDGVIDNFIVVHAGPDQADGGGTMGSDAIWSHRTSLVDGTYEVQSHDGKKYGVYDYTMDPQDGAPSVFCHEFGHDLGLPDEYDTRSTGKGEPVGAWSLMAAGTNVGLISGTETTGFSPWCKNFLQANYGGNWLKGTTLNINEITEEGMDFDLDQASTKGTNNDVVKINLPSKETHVNTPASGKYAYFGGKDDVLRNSMTTTIDLTQKQNAKLKFKTWYQIEEGWDFASIQVREKGKEEWKAIKGNITTDQRDPQASVIVENGITGDSKGWIDAEFDLSEYKGKEIEVKFSYETDAASNEEGFYVDDIVILADGVEILADNAEGETKFTTLKDKNNKSIYDFVKSDGKRYAKEYYLLEWRNHHGTDSGLAYGNINGKPFSYDPGLVIWHADDSVEYNWVGKHPGECFSAVVDANQNPPVLVDVKTNKVGALGRPSQLYINDAAFSLKKGERMYLDFIHDKDENGNDLNFYVADYNIFMHPIFDDSNDYTNKFNTHAGLKLPKNGLKVYVTGENKDRSIGRIHISRTTK